ncbi:MAG: hypothetical protein WC816_12430 [Sphingomonas sp.]|jgi:hypothetical protein
MQPSSILCRAQEASQRSRAAAATLENIRAQANLAATAWAREAVCAERREARMLRLHRPAVQPACEILPKFSAEEEMAFSENPDMDFDVIEKSLNISS